jgi:hypothetical protein
MAQNYRVVSRHVRAWEGHAPQLVPALKAPAKNGIFEPFIYKNDHFTKTGSGQS